MSTQKFTSNLIYESVLISAIWLMKSQICAGPWCFCFDIALVLRQASGKPSTWCPLGKLVEQESCSFFLLSFMFPHLFYLFFIFILPLFCSLPSSPFSLPFFLFLLSSLFLIFHLLFCYSSHHQSESKNRETQIF